MASTGYIILRDIPKNKAIIDGIEVPIEGGFRGFKGVPAGRHELGLIDSDQSMIDFEAVVPAGGAIVLRYNEGKMVLDVENGAHFTQLAISGSMNQALKPYPAEAQSAPPPSTVDMTALLALLNMSGKTKCTAEDLTRIDAAYEAFRTRGDDRAYGDVLKYNYIVDYEMAEHAEYFVSYGRKVLAHLKASPEIGRAGYPRMYLDYLKQDLQDIDNSAAAAIGVEMESLLR